MSGLSHIRTNDCLARVLIVEETDFVRKALELAVKRKMVHEVEITSDALAAVGLALASLLDLALVDWSR
jgi:DNA-binding response OmpR family regulator